MQQLNKTQAHTINGVAGTMSDVLAHDNGLIYKQVWKGSSRPVKGYGKGAYIVPEVRFDDHCSNRHMDFAITAHVNSPGARDWVACGCLHEDIAKVFPELAPLIKWHLSSTDGPMHYIGNTVYHATNLDNGRAKGEPCRWKYGYRFGNSPVTKILNPYFYEWIEAKREFNKTAAKTNPDYGFKVKELPYVKKAGETYNFDPKYTLEGYGEKWHDGPFDTLAEAEEFALALNTCQVQPMKVVTDYSKGKERQLDYARSSACWPEATDEQLCLPEAELTKLLEARLPKLKADFKEAMLACGFLWSELEKVAA